MKIALVYPEVYELAHYKEKRKEFPPFGVLYLAAVLEQNNIEVAIFQINEGEKELDLYEYDIVGFSIPSSATYNLVKHARFHSTYQENKTIAIGGVHPTFYPQETLVDLNADVVTIGNGEKTILEIVKAHSNKDFSKCAGACYHTGKSITTTKQSPLENSLDWLPLPARHLLPESDFIMSNRLSNTDLRMAHVMFSRGCPFSCTFCAVAQKKIQYRSGTHARIELEHLQAVHKIDGFAIVDDNFIVNKNIVKNVCSEIKGLNLRWSALSRVDTIDYELLETMHEAGCIELKFGVESGSEVL